jgi:predicted RNA-binding Zn ribbon-like protein
MHLSSGEYWCYHLCMVSAASDSLAAALPFKYVGGDPSIDLVNTVDWTTRGLVDERLTDYERLTRWAEGAGVLVPRLASQLRALALEQPRVAERVHREARDLRWQLRQLFTAVERGERIDRITELQPFNEALRATLPRLELAAQVRSADGRAPALWAWRDASERLDSLLWPVVRSAADLLVSDEARRIRECGGEDCGWMYVDRSRNGLRRWCQMETCGNREKQRKRAGRR